MALWPPPLGGFHRLEIADDIALTLLFGDAEETLRVADSGVGADAVFLDGFAPQSNPAMWSEGLLAAVTRHCRPQSTLATWCVAGDIRRRLAALGWEVLRAPGFAAKRQMLRGTLANARPSRPGRAATRSAVPPPLCFGGPREAIVIGAGIAGCAVAARLAARGWTVTIIDAHDAPAGGASGNHAGILLPRLARDDALAARLSRAAFLHAVRLLDDLGPTAWLPCGVLQLAANEEDAAYQRDCIARGQFPAAFAQWLDAPAAHVRLGRGFASPRDGGWWFPAGGRVAPALACHALLTRDDGRITRRFGHSVRAIERDASGCWVVIGDDGAGGARGEPARAPQLVLACAERIPALLSPLLTAHLPLDRVRGQTTTFDADACPPLDGLEIAVCGEGYVTPAREGRICIGASFHRGDGDLVERLADHRANLARIERLLPGSVDGLAPESCAGRVGVRATTPDRLPYAGLLPDVAVPVRGDPGLRGMPRMPGLSMIGGLGSRGLMWAPLAAEILVSRIAGEPLPVPRRFADALDPARYYLRALRRLT